MTKGKLVHLTGTEIFAPDLLASVTAYMFLQYGYTAACIFAAGQGFFIDLLSGGMHGLFTFLYLIVFAGVWLGSRFFNLQSPKGQIVIVSLAMLSKKVFLFIMLTAFSQGTFFSRDFWWACLGTILCTGLISPVLIYLLDHLRAVAFKIMQDTSKDQI
jgi:rod shape-determining protein MreD